MPKALVTTVPFAQQDSRPIELLEGANIDYVVNPIGRKLREEELAEMITDFDVLIAGTEPITARVLRRATNLKLISRVGIGLDSVDLLAAEAQKIQVSYTPDAPAPAVAELTLGLMFSLLRHVHVANAQMHRGEWHRHFGRRLAETSVGIVGLGRIGTRVAEHVAALGARRILVNDLKPHALANNLSRVEWVDKDTLYREADVISVHVPLTKHTKNMITLEHLKRMKPDAVLINTARGGIVNERDLARVLNSGHLAGAAVDVFEKEPYDGELAGIERCLLTSHMGSMSIDCRTQMEVEATEEAVRYLTGQPLQGLVPAEEYDVQRQGL